MPRDRGQVPASVRRVARALGSTAHRAPSTTSGKRADQARGVAADVRAAGGRAFVLEGGRRVIRRSRPLGRGHRRGVPDAWTAGSTTPAARCGAPISADISDVFYDELDEPQLPLRVRDVPGGGAPVPGTGERHHHQHHVGGGRCTRGGPGALVYAAAKAAVNNLTRGLQELAPHRIRVNAISPAWSCARSDPRALRRHGDHGKGPSSPGPMGGPRRPRSASARSSSWHPTAFPATSPGRSEVNGGQFMP